MKYILDFDGVLFNTAEFKKWIAKNIGEHPRNRQLISKLQQKIDSGELDMRSFVFRDASEFLEAHKENTLVVSSSVSLIDDNNEVDLSEAIEFQEFKIKASGIADLVRYEVVGESKTEVISNELQNNPLIKYAFVDDSSVHLRDAESFGDRIQFISMRREQKWSPETINERVEFDTISDFSRIEEITSSWERRG